MGGHRIASRILGVVPTSHGYAYALTEGPERLLDWARSDFKKHQSPRGRLDRLLARTRPLFVTSEIDRNERRSDRGRQFNAILKAVCAKYGVMILCVERELVYTARHGRRPVTNHELAEAAAARFPLIANKLPRRRRLWDGYDDRIGILLAAAAAMAGWKYFQTGRENIPSSSESPP